MKPPRVFITGIAGFAGSYLAADLLEQGYRVAGSIYNHEPTDNIREIESDLELYNLDIIDANSCLKVLKKGKPDYICHLAAFASVGRSHHKVRGTLKVNIDGTVNVLETARELRKLKALLFVSSADVYGIFKPKNQTLTEDQPANPVSPYGIAKMTGERLCAYYHKVHEVPAVIARAFNHGGPRQTDDFVVPAFAKQVAQIEKGRQKPVLKVGDLSARRDFSDVRDIIRGYRLAMEKGKAGEIYQLCSGKAVPVQRVLDNLLKLSTREITVKVDPSRLRKSDIPLLRGSNRKAVSRLGYTVRYTLKETLADTLDFWRARLG